MKKTKAQKTGRKLPVPPQLLTVKKLISLLEKMPKDAAVFVDTRGEKGWIWPTDVEYWANCVVIWSDDPEYR